MFDAWQAARVRGLNNRAAALDAGVSEVELLASGCGRGVTRLGGDYLALLQALPELGEIKSVIRNAFAVQERTGRVLSVKADAASALVQGDTFLLHGEIGEWTRGFALTENGKYSVKRSFQFFTATGTSAAKCFLTRASNETRYQSLVRRFAAEDQTSVEAGIFAITGSAEASRTQLTAGSLANCLFEASRLGVPVEVSVVNEAASQITVKAFERIKRSDRGGWINVLDAGLDLHLHEDRIGYVEALSDGDGVTLRWFADDGSEALTMRTQTQGAALMAAATSIAADNGKR